MKKYLALFLALAMLLLCAACGNSDSTDTSDSLESNPPASENPSVDDEKTPPADEGEDAGIESPILIEAETGEGFACVLLDNGDVFWQKGIDSPSTIQTMNDLRGAPMALMQVVPVGDDWQVQIIGDEIPDWYLEEQEEMEQAIWDALAEWEAAPEVEAVDIGPIPVEAESTEGGRMFACVLLDTGDIYWDTEGAITQPSELVAANGLEDAVKAEIQVVHMPGDIWQMQVVGEVPAWLADDNDMQLVVWNTFNQWKDAN